MEREISGYYFDVTNFGFCTKMNDGKINKGGWKDER